MNAQKLSLAIEVANRQYKQWSDLYKADLLYEYYKGFHYADKDNDNYFLNLVYSTIEIKLPSLVFNLPKFNVSPRAKDIDIDSESAFEYAINLQDILHDWISIDEVEFLGEMEGAILNAFFGFGIVELGYSANWVDNPNAGKPILARDIEQTDSKKVVRQPRRIPSSEAIYIKHILSNRFRVSYPANRYLHRCDWCGYYDFVRLVDLQANKELNLSKVSDTSAYFYESSVITSELPTDEDKLRIELADDYLKVWKIWHNRTGERYIYLEGPNQILQTRRFTELPLIDLRFRKPLRGFYPTPPQVFNWIPAQNEQNEVREAMRRHRRKFKRMYAYLKQAVDPDELAKAITGDDGEIVAEGVRDAIRAITSPDLNATSDKLLVVSKDDFNIVSGTTSEARGTADRETATQAAIKNNRAGIRESAEQAVTAKFYNKVAKLGLTFMKERYVLPVTVMGDQELEGSIGETASLNSRQPKRINPLLDLGPQAFQFDVMLQLDSTSPVANAQELEKFLQFLSLLTQFPQTSISPLIIREMAFRVGYRNERVIKEFQQLAQLQLIGLLEQGMGNLGQTTTQQMIPPNATQVQNQLQKQGIPINNG